VELLLTLSQKIKKVFTKLNLNVINVNVLEQTLNNNNNRMETLKKKLEEVAGQWNGDESGLKEDRANEAFYLLEEIDRIEKSAANLLNQ